MLTEQNIDTRVVTIAFIEVGSRLERACRNPRRYLPE
jgi:hypothetical protein